MTDDPHDPADLDGTVALVEFLNGVHVTKKDLIRVIDTANHEHETMGGHDILGMFTAAKVFKRNKDKARAIIFRMRALSEMIESDELQGWTLGKSDDGKAFADDAVLAAVAVHPLSVVNGRIKFERESFMTRVLELAEPAGNA